MLKWARQNVCSLDAFFRFLVRTWGVLGANPVPFGTICTGALERK
jgi:hypothetical protein